MLVCQMTIIGINMIKFMKLHRLSYWFMQCNVSISVVKFGETTVNNFLIR